MRHSWKCIVCRLRNIGNILANIIIILACDVLFLKMSAISSNPSSSKFSSVEKNLKKGQLEENSINDIDIFHYIPNISKPVDNVFS